MKKYLFAFLMMLVSSFTLVTVTSCGDDDDDEESYEVARIYGTWQEDNTDEGVWQWTFMRNGQGRCTVINNDTSVSFEFTYAYDGTNLSITGEEDGETYTDNYTVTVNDNTHVTIVDKDGGDTLTLTKIK